MGFVGSTRSDMAKKIAVTGGIGSGKSTLMRAFADLGEVCFSADAIYRELCEDEEFVKDVSAAVGVKPITVDGKLRLNKEEISKLAFADAEILKRLNSATHGRVMAELESRVKAAGKTAYCEVPLLYEGGFETLFDCVIVVRRGDAERIAAVAVRDGKTPEQVVAVIKNQFDYSKIKKDEHTIIVDNDGDGELLYEKAKMLVDRLRS